VGAHVSGVRGHHRWISTICTCELHPASPNSSRTWVHMCQGLEGGQGTIQGSAPSVLANSIQHRYVHLARGCTWTHVCEGIEGGEGTIDGHALLQVLQEGGGRLLLHRGRRQARLQVIHQPPKECAEVLCPPDVAWNLQHTHKRVTVLFF
jgi:hypothetical protein